MIKINDIAIYNSTIKEFFKLTESTPKELIAWVKRNKDEEFPCLRECYEGYSLCSYNPRRSKNREVRMYKTPSPSVFLPFEILSVWEIISEDEKEFKRFAKYLKSIKI